MECKNGHTALTVGSYCPNCGARMVEQRLSVGTLVKDGVLNFLSWDAAFFKTFRRLAVQPQEVIGSYFEGVRKRYFNPFSYLFITVTLLTLLRNLMPITNTDYDQFLNAEQLRSLEEQINAQTSPYSNLSFLMFLPALALLSFLTFRRRTMNYAEHLILSIYVTGQVNFYGVMIALFDRLFMHSILVQTAIAIAVYVIYYAFVFIKLYALSFAEFIKASARFFLYSFVLLLIAVAASAIWKYIEMN